MSKIYPNLGLIGDFDPCGEAGSVEALNRDIKTLDDLVLQDVREVSTLPTSPTTGDAVVLTTDNKIYVYGGTTWSSYTPKSGWYFMEEGGQTLLVYDGLNWQRKLLPDSNSGLVLALENAGYGEALVDDTDSSLGLYRIKSILSNGSVMISQDPNDSSGNTLLLEYYGIDDITNLGVGEPLYTGTIGNYAELKSIQGGSGIEVSSTSTDVVISQGETYRNFKEINTNYMVQPEDHVIFLRASQIDVRLPDPALNLGRQLVFFASYAASFNQGTTFKDPNGLDLFISSEFFTMLGGDNLGKPLKFRALTRNGVSFWVIEDAPRYAKESVLPSGSITLTNTIQPQVTWLIDYHPEGVNYIVDVEIPFDVSGSPVSIESRVLMGSGTVSRRVETYQVGQHTFKRRVGPFDSSGYAGSPNLSIELAMGVLGSPSGSAVLRPNNNYLEKCLLFGSLDRFN